MANLFLRGGMICDFDGERETWDLPTRDGHCAAQSILPCQLMLGIARLNLSCFARVAPRTTGIASRAGTLVSENRLP
ncbi:MAG: hypothetical protein WAZ48_07100 [Lysobacteraceae bacterium]